MGINANVSGGQQITASVGETKIDVAVSGGVGPSGAGGPAATITVGTVTTGAPGSSASVVNAGTSSAAVLNFTIPAGAAGAAGAKGDQGDTGPQGPSGVVTANAPITYDPVTQTVGLAIGTGTNGLVVSNGALYLGSHAWLHASGGPDEISPASIGAASAVHTHVIGDVSGLQSALDAKATPADVTSAVAAVVNAAPASLDTLKELADALGNDANFASTVTNAIAGKAAAVHTHVIADVTGLQTALDGKQASGSYAASVHTHGISDVTGLQTALDGKQAAGSYAAATHGHSISDVTGLQTALDGKAAASHTHTVAQITDFSSTLASPPAIGGTTPAAGSFTTLAASTSLAVPSGASGTPAAGHVYRSADTLRYRDSTNTERLLLNSADNLANLGNTATARTNLGLGYATTAQAQDGVSTTVAMNPARTLDEIYNVYQIDLSQSSVFSTGNGTLWQTAFAGSINIQAGNASGGGTVITRHGNWWSSSLPKWNNSTGNFSGRRINWTRRQRFRIRVMPFGVLTANAVFRCIHGKTVSGVGSAGALSTRGIGFELRSGNALWLTTHNGTSRTDTNANTTLFASGNNGALYEIVAESDAAGNANLFLDGTLVATSTGAPTTEATANFEQEFFAVEIVTTDSSAVIIGFDRHPQVLRP